MISVVTWLWQEGFRDYCAEHINTLAHLFRKRLSLPHRFICVTDDAAGLGAHVEPLITPAAAAAIGYLRNPEGARFPSCYRRLWMFSDDARVLGDRVMLTDLDAIPVRELAPLFDIEGDFVGWRPLMTWGDRARVGGGSYLLTPGTRTQVWTDFQGQASIAEARRAGYRGSDQAWLSYKLGKGERYWNDRAGIYSIRDMRNGALPLPDDARLVHFNGPQKPWTSPLPWVKEHWR